MSPYQKSEKITGHDHADQPVAVTFQATADCNKGVEQAQAQQHQGDPGQQRSDRQHEPEHKSCRCLQVTHTKAFPAPDLAGCLPAVSAFRIEFTARISAPVTVAFHGVVLVRLQPAFQACHLTILHSCQQCKRQYGANECSEHVRLRIPGIALGAEKLVCPLPQDQRGAPLDQFVPGPAAGFHAPAMPARRPGQNGRSCRTDCAADETSFLARSRTALWHKCMRRRQSGSGPGGK